MSLRRVAAGFIPLLDCAPLVVAAEKGFAEAEGLELVLMRESSWANIRDRLLVGQFDVAHMLGPMTVASTLGVGHVKSPLIAPCALGLGGNAITVSASLWEQMEGVGASLGAELAVQGAALARVVRARSQRPLTFGMVYPFSMHNYLLRYWLAAAGVDPDHDVQLVVIPPPLLVDALREGQVDGFCVGEPWNSLAVDAGVGVIIGATSAIWRRSPEKVLGCRLEWAQRQAPVLAALLRAVHAAAAWCDRRENAAELAQILSAPRYVAAPAHVLLRALTNALVLRRGAASRDSPDFYTPARDFALYPWVSHVEWFYSQMLRWRQLEFHESHLAQVRAAYRPDLYVAALARSAPDALPGADPRNPPRARATETFFDGAPFTTV